jgi:ribonucleoside-diphosphate reductase alpha chain
MTGFLRYGVSPETLLLTSNGYVPIGQLAEQEVDIWNGSEFEPTSVFKMAEQQPLIRVTMTNGTEIECSKNQLFIVQPGYEPVNLKIVEAQNLEVGERLTKSPSFPTIKSGSKEFPYAYTHGFYVGAEKYRRTTNKTSRAAIYGVRRPLLDILDINRDLTDRVNLYFKEDMPHHTELPLGENYSIQTRLEWLAGFFDGGLAKRKITDRPIWCAYSNSGDLLNNVRLLVQTLGGDTRVIKNDDMTRAPYSWRISGMAMQNLVKLEIPTKYLKLPVIEYKRRGVTSPKVLKIEDSFRDSDIYNFVGTERKTAIFNGLYTQSN